jgi:hypothetical protein
MKVEAGRPENRCAAPRAKDECCDDNNKMRARALVHSDPISINIKTITLHLTSSIPSIKGGCLETVMMIK